MVNFGKLLYLYGLGEELKAIYSDIALALNINIH